MESNKVGSVSFGLEVCANSFISAIAAQIGGAIRVELCENMAEGGTTPSYGQVKLCKERLSIAVWPIIRPRGGDFLYNDEEFEVMKADIECFKALGCNGIVTGILLANGEIDKSRCKALVDLAKPMPVAFHRAFDLCNDMEQALFTLIELGFVRVLTSGGAKNALDGATQLSKLVDLANGKIEIMPGAGINPTNIKAIKEQTGANVFHSSARIKVPSEMLFKNTTSHLGQVPDDYEHEQTSSALVKLMVTAIQ